LLKGLSVAVDPVGEANASGEADAQEDSRDAIDRPPPSMNPHTPPVLAHAAPIAARLLAGISGLLVLLVLAPAAASAATVSPLPESDYAVRSACSAPEPGYAGCLALELEPRTSAARAHTHPLGITRRGPIKTLTPAEGGYGLRPGDLHNAYQLPSTTFSTQTIAIIDAYTDSTAEHDLGVYDQEFGLPSCTAADKCFKQLNQRGEAGKLPVTKSNEKTEADGWAIETSLDIEVAHAICQNCQIMLVEANSPTFANLEEAENTAVSAGATEVSDSWGGSEQGEITPQEDETDAFNHPGTVITAAAGDDGYLDWDAKEASERGYPDYPASSPHVIAVGGTRLSLNAEGKWGEETVWNGDGAGGGGCSTELEAPAWQRSVADWSAVGCGAHRAVADVSADADPYTGVAIYDSTPESPTKGGPGWIPIGGTSASSPLIASVFALAGGAGKNANDETVKYPAQTLYEGLAGTPGSWHDVVSGSNGECTKPFENGTGISGCTALQEATNCSEEAICLATPGYDGPTGVGTPDGIAAFASASEAQRVKKAEEERKAEEEKKAAEKKAAEKKKAEEEQKAAERKAEEEKIAAEKKAAEEKKAEEERKAAEKKAEEEGKSGTQKTEEKTNDEAGKDDEEEPNASGGDTGSEDEDAGSTEQSPSIVPSGAPLTTGPLPSEPLAHPASPPVPILSAPALTRTATAALSRDAPPKVSQIAFAFTLNMAARVRATLTKLVLVHGHDRWVPVPGTLTFTAAKGRGQRQLTNRDALTPGRYRLTLTPAGGAARTITFHVS
jgi:hypothetical protein